LKQNVLVPFATTILLLGMWVQITQHFINLAAKLVQFWQVVQPPFKVIKD
jgi:hypothetical protein